jgi:NAD(P)-dependent dehydrogenase (short-subunit alcohol dehydrogenase family)
MNDQISGKVAIITGGMNGIGRACTTMLYKAGARVVIADLDISQAGRIINEISPEAHSRVMAIEADVSRPDECQQLIQKATQAFKKLDILVNCAALFMQRPVLEMSPDEWQRIFEVNVHGVFYLSQAFAHQINRQKRDVPATSAVHLQEAAGVIVNISSLAASHMMPGRTAYSASKAALNALTQALAFEWASDNIRVNAVAPSHVNTARIRQVAAQGKLDLEPIAARIPLGRLAEPEEIADAVLFLCGPSSRFVTGQILYVDGGYSVNGSW